MKVMMRAIFVTKVMILYHTHPTKFKLKTHLHGKETILIKGQIGRVETFGQVN